MIGKTSRSCQRETDTTAMRNLLDHYTEGLTKSRKKHPTYSRKTIAVIGTTGFLGPYILAALIKTHNASHIFCLNRTDDAGKRTTSALKGIMGLESADLLRLRFLKVDITKAGFGLDLAQAHQLACCLDEMVFSAWDANWIKPLDQFHPFMKGLRNSIDFCIAACKQPRITFISSVCSVGDWPLVHPAQPRIPEEVVWDNACAMPHGYGRSKCVAEQLLSRASAASGLSINIVRAGQIGGPSDPTLGTWPPQGWLCSIIATSRKLGCFPDRVQPLDWIPVDRLADGIAACTERELRPNSIEVFNMIHPRPAPWNMLYHTLQRQCGFSGELVNLQQWLAVSDPAEVKLHSFLEATKGGRERNMSFSNENAVRILAPVQPITPELLSDWLKSWHFRDKEVKARL